MSAAVLLPLDLAALAARVPAPRSGFSVRLRPEGALLLAENPQPYALADLMAASSASSASRAEPGVVAPLPVDRSRR